VVFQALNREQTFLDLNAAQLDGSVQKVLQETTPAWVEVDDDPTFIKRDGTMLWQSSRSGWKHLYLYDGRGQLQRQLTNGNWEVRSLYGVDEANGWVYFSASKDSPIADNVYRVKLSGGEVERLTKGDGNHSASFNSTFTQFVDTWSDINTPPQTRLYNADGSLVRVINENKVAALGEFKLGKPEFMQVKTRDGFEMEAVMIKPPDFDPNKKYPVFSYTYSGRIPHRLGMHGAVIATCGIRCSRKRDLSSGSATTARRAAKASNRSGRSTRIWARSSCGISRTVLVI
jgi:dipeptidyl-peptidase-4